MEGVLQTIFEFLIIFGVSTFVVIVFHLIRQPVVAGFLISGAIVGPYGFGWIDDLDRVHVLAEIGVILLLFSIGVEFSIKQLMQVKKAFFGLGALQCGVTTLLVAFLFGLLGVDEKTSLVFGFLVSLSSTAIVLKILQQHRHTLAPHGKISIAVLLFQDLWIVPLMIFIPFLAGGQETEGHWIEFIVKAFSKAGLLFAGIFVASKYIIPQTLRFVAKTRIRELFLIAVALFSLGAAYATYELGLTLALGAFVAGFMISESDYGHQAVADVIPLRDMFMAVFFVSVGALLDFRFVMENWEGILLIASCVLIVKFLVTASSASLLGFHSRIAAVVAIVLAQIGEFSFILAEQARKFEMMDVSQYQYFLAVTLVLMIVTPSLIQLAPRIAPSLSALDIVPQAIAPLKKLVPEEYKQKKKAKKPSELINHVVIVGFGINGESLARVLYNLKVPYSVVELNPEKVEEWKGKGANMIYGDASREEVLHAAGILRARMVTVLISDPSWVHHVVRAIRRLRTDIHILVRSMYFQEVEELELAGASDIVVGELEAGIEIFSRVLRYYGVAEDAIETSMKKMHAEKYQSLRQYISKPIETEGFMGWLSSSEILPVLLPENSPAVKRELSELHIRERTGALVVTVYRKNLGYRVPDPGFVFEAGDLIYLVGEAEGTRRAEDWLLGSHGRSLETI